MGQKLNKAKEIRLGILGMSPGNAHPYSWSSIINGAYDGAEIERVGYPGVTDYLDHYRDELGIPGARVTHVWTQDPDITRSIALSSGIVHQAGHYEEMIGNVDAVIIARDDPDTHRAMAEPFIEAGVPVFIDKPLAANEEDLRYFQEKSEAGSWIMSCSSMRYADEVKEAGKTIKQLGQIQLVTAVGKKDWLKYGVHMLEALFTILDDPQPVSIWSVGEPDQAIMRVEFMDGSLATVHLFQHISSTFQVAVYGDKNFGVYHIRDSYKMFRANMEVFIQGLREGEPLLAFEKTLNIIRTVIGGLDSMRTGKKVLL